MATRYEWMDAGRPYFTADVVPGYTVLGEDRVRIGNCALVLCGDVTVVVEGNAATLRRTLQGLIDGLPADTGAEDEESKFITLTHTSVLQAKRTVSREDLTAAVAAAISPDEQEEAQRALAQMDVHRLVEIAGEVISEERSDYLTQGWLERYEQIVDGSLEGRPAEPWEARSPDTL